MAPSISKKRKLDDSHPIKAQKKVRKQKYYSSPSSSSAEEEEEFPPVDLADSGSDAISDASSKASPQPTTVQSGDFSSAFDSEEEIDSDSDASQSSASEPTHPDNAKPTNTKSKRNDPAVFASSMSAILGSKLTTSKRSDPVLARSATAAEANASIANTKLETKARTKLREDKKEALEKGRVKDVLLGTDNIGGGSVEEMMEEEKRLRKTAQRGVVKLFNAVRQAQVKSEEAAKESKGLSRGRKEEKVTEMSKKGFLELVAGGGTAPKKMSQPNIEEG